MTYIILRAALSLPQVWKLYVFPSPQYFRTSMQHLQNLFYEMVAVFLRHLSPKSSVLLLTDIYCMCTHELQPPSFCHVWKYPSIECVACLTAVCDLNLLESRKRSSGLYFCLWRRCRASPCSQRGQGVSAWQPLGNGDAVQQGAELAAVENLGRREGRRERRQRSCLYRRGLSSSGKAHSSQAPGAASGVTGQLVLQSSADLPKRPVGFQHLCGFSLASFHCLFCW